MKSAGVLLDDYSSMSSPDHANEVLATLTPRNGKPPAMPPGGPYWTPAQLALFTQWQKKPRLRAFPAARELVVK